MFIHKTTREERLKNGAVLDKIMFSLFDANATAIKEILSERGTFLGNNKIQFLSKLNSYFVFLKDKGIKGVGIHFGICVDTLPGCEVMEVRYALSNNLLNEEGLYFSKAMSSLGEGEEMIRFAFRLRNGKVEEIKSSGKYLLKKPNEIDDDLNLN